MMKNHLSVLRKYSVLFLLFSTIVFFGQEKKKKDTAFNANSKTFVAVPIVSNSPTMKTGFGGMGMYFFKVNKNDSLTPPSLVTLYATYTTNNSYVIAPFGKIFWDENKNRVTLGGTFLRINNDFEYSDESTGDIRLVYTEFRKFFTAEYSRKIVGDFYLGLFYLASITDYEFNKGTDEENDFTEEFFKQNGIEDNFTSSLGLNLLFDNRDYPYYPTKGVFASIRPKIYTSWLGSSNDYTDIDYKASYYHSFRENMILATNLSGGFAFGDVPFDGYQNYGVRNSLRGYPTGKYKGKNMIAAQAEFRWRFYKRWGAVAFAGTGNVWGNETSNSVFERDWLPSAGIGARYMISKQKKVNIRLDYSFGVDGNQGLYFGVMESF